MKHVFGTIELDTRAASTEGIPCTLSTETPVTRDGYAEILSHEAGAINLGRAERGLPLLAFHQQETPVGRVDGIRLDEVARKLRGFLRFGSSAEAQQIQADVLGGILTDLSVGYQITESHQDGDTLIATSWEPFECSIVSVPADPQAGINRSINIVGANTMQTQTEIKELCIRHGFPELERSLISGSLEAARNAILEKLAERSESFITRPGFPMHTGEESNAVAVNTLASRMGCSVNGEIDARASVVDFATRSMQQAGMRVTSSMNRQQIIERSLTTSDFPTILGNAIGRVLFDGYNLTPAVLKAVARQVMLPDFRARTVARLGASPDLIQVNEAGEYHYGGLSGSSAAYALATYGRIITLSRQALVNDDLSAFGDLIRKFGESGARREADSMAAVLLANPAVDGVAMFDATKGSLLTGAPSALAATGLANAVMKLRMQKENDGGFIAAEPGALVVPAALEVAAKQLTATINATKTGDVNPLGSGLKVIVEPRLDAASATAWYLVANGSTSLEYAYLEGQAGVYTETRDGWGVDGTEIKARLDFATGFVAPTGWIKSAGI